MYVSIPYKSGQHFKDLLELIKHWQEEFVSIPYKSGQHFKEDGAMITRVRDSNGVSIPYKSGQHFKDDEYPIPRPLYVRRFNPLQIGSTLQTQPQSS